MDSTAIVNDWMLFFGELSKSIGLTVERKLHTSQNADEMPSVNFHSLACDFSVSPSIGSY